MQQADETTTFVKELAVLLKNPSNFYNVIIERSGKSLQNVGVQCSTVYN